jgi:adenine-specific DNA methylase
MIPKECKRLAEVDFPIATVGRNSAKENNVRFGHPKTLHLWWARRPLAACRAVLLGILLPDPCDAHCPIQFKDRARKILTAVQGPPEAGDNHLRQALIRFIGDLSGYDVANSPVYLEAARNLISTIHEEPITVADPFSGGGSIPFESLRLGCHTIATDLNPVACLLLKEILQDIPRQGLDLANEFLSAANQIRVTVEKKVQGYFKGGPESNPAVYLWARQVRCESGKCGLTFPLVRSFWLSKRKNRRRAIRYCVFPSTVTPRLEFELYTPENDSDIQRGTVVNGKATCPACSISLASSRLQAQLTEQEGGAQTALLWAVVTSSNGRTGRGYRLPQQIDIQQATSAAEVFQDQLRQGEIPRDLTERMSPVRPSPNARGVSAPTRYGITSFKGLFTVRQRLVLLTIAQEIARSAVSEPVKTLLAFALDKMAMQNNAHCRWKATGESVVDMFGRHAISMVWDFSESVPFGGGTGSWDSAVRWVDGAVRSIAELPLDSAQVQQADAQHSPLPSESVEVWFTDPPYYDNIPYADLADFFFVWQKRCQLGVSFKSEDGLSPKSNEAVWNQAHVIDGTPKDKLFFEQAIARACVEGRRILTNDGIGCVVFAHKTTEGWEALLSGITKAGWVVTASWPIATELETRVSARDSASLATSVHLICRPRPANASVGDWSDILQDLPISIGNWVERLSREGVHGADLVFACIGPAIEVYSRYLRVEDAEGREIPMGGNPAANAAFERGFLSYVWEIVGRIALEQVLGTAEAQARNGGAGALEEDSRLTALFLWTLQSTELDIEEEPSDNEEDAEADDQDEEPTTGTKRKAGFKLIYDVARRFAQPLGIHLERWEGRIIETEKGVVRLLPVAERAKMLFGEADAAAIARRIEDDARVDPQQVFSFMAEARLAPEIKTRGMRNKKSRKQDQRTDEPHAATTLDRVHAAMLLQSSGRTNALRALLKAEQERGPDFIRLANALSALYPKSSDEKRLIDAMLLAAPGRTTPN